MKKLSTLFFIIISTFVYSQSWNYLNTSSIMYNQISIYAFNEDTIITIGDCGSIYKSIDSGNSWSVLYSGNSSHLKDIDFSDNDTGYCVGQNGTIIKSIDNGSTWTIINSGVSINLNAIYIKSAEDIWAVGDSGLILNSTDYGNTWNSIFSNTYQDLNDIKFLNSDTGFIACDSGILLTTINTGILWNMQCLDSVYYVDLIKLELTNNYSYIIGGSIYSFFEIYPGNLFISGNFINWNKYSYYFGKYSIDFINDSVGFACSSIIPVKLDVIEIFKTFDYGQSWNKIYTDNSPPFYYTNQSDVFFISDSIGFVLSGSSILKTINGGELSYKNEISKSQEILIFVNPDNQSINILFDMSEYSKTEIRIIDILGHIKTTIPVTSERTLIKTEGWAK
ncbi:MAG: YCF48-related protein [Bacteroidota bacterium]